MKLSSFLPLATTATLVAGSLPFLHSAEAAAGSALGDAEIDLTLIFEVNATDGDGEVVLDLDTDLALERLTLFDPDHRAVVKLATKDRGQLGISQMELETAEPSIEAVVQAYPEGVYHAVLRTTSHETFHVFVELRHALPELPVITFPVPDGDVPASGAVVTWTPDPAVEAWVVEIENDELEQTLTAELPAGAASFSIPDGFLVQGETYQLGIAATGENGNVLVVEQDFVVQ